jgi:glutathione S-transferase
MDQWAILKDKMPMGQLPVLEVDGVKLCQTTAICRYLAKETGIYGKTHLDQCRGDMLVEGVMDLWSALRPTYMAKFKDDASDEDKEFAKFKAEYLNKFLRLYEGFLTETNTGYFVGDSLTWADIIVAEFVSVLDECFHASVGTEHPKLKEFSRKILSLPFIKEHIASRPSTLF